MKVVLSTFLSIGLLASAGFKVKEYTHSVDDIRKLYNARRAENSPAIAFMESLTLGNDGKLYLNQTSPMSAGEFMKELVKAGCAKDFYGLIIGFTPACTPKQNIDRMLKDLNCDNQVAESVFEILDAAIVTCMLNDYLVEQDSKEFEKLLRNINVDLKNACKSTLAIQKSTPDYSAFYKECIAICKDNAKPMVNVNGNNKVISIEIDTQKAGEAYEKLAKAFPEYLLRLASQKNPDASGENDAPKSGSNDARKKNDASKSDISNLFGTEGKVLSVSLLAIFSFLILWNKHRMTV